ncbi:MAG TPA: hypothetical protein VKB86_22010 [Pyrinomonadaceae bacterium]|nr:hypothetical protein [Pyrinomonadaceae bacterium]
MLWRRLISLFALIILLCSTLVAQTTEDKSTLDRQEREQKAIEMKKELERKTFTLLDEVISSAGTLKLPENHALVLSSAADLLWARDEKRARALFKEAMNALTSVAVPFDEKMKDEERTAYWRFMQQRKEILQMVARRDADLALELLRDSRPQTLSTSNAGKSFSRPQDDSDLEQSLAVQVAMNDPKRAFQMAEEDLSKGYSGQLLSLVTHLNDKDSDLAARLVTEIIDKLHSENLATNQDAALLAMQLLQIGIKHESGGFELLSSYQIGRKPFSLDEHKISDLLGMVTTAALGETSNSSLISMLPYLMPDIEKRLPERAQLLRRRIGEFVRTLDPDQRLYFENAELIRSGSIEAILETAAKASGKARDMLYEQAAWKAFNHGDEERAHQIINDNIRDSSNRDRILESLDRAALWNSISKDKLDDVRQRIARLKSKDERAGVLAQLAFDAAVKKDRKLALEFLDEARPLITMKPKTDMQLYTLLQVVRTYALVEPARAFEMIESLVDEANELLAAASVLNGFLLPKGVFRNGEMMLTPGYTQISMQFRQFGKELGALALLNFERTKNAADRFQRNETRIMARLFIAQGVLSEKLGSGVALYESGVMVGY